MINNLAWAARGSGRGRDTRILPRVTSSKTIAFITELHTSDTREGRIMIAGIRGGTSLGRGGLEMCLYHKYQPSRINPSARGDNSMIRFIAFADCCNSNTITLNDNLFYFSNISCEHLWGSWVINFQYRYLSVYSWCRCLAISLSYYITQGVLLLQTNYCSASICSGATACK